MQGRSKSFRRNPIPECVFLLLGNNIYVGIVAVQSYIFIYDTQELLLFRQQYIVTMYHLYEIKMYYYYIQGLLLSMLRILRTTIAVWQNLPPYVRLIRDRDIGTIWRLVSDSPHSYGCFEYPDPGASYLPLFYIMLRFSFSERSCIGLTIKSFYFCNVFFL